MAKQVIVKNGQIQGNNGQALSLQNLQPENIKKDVNIGGVVGSYTGEEVNTKWYPHYPSANETSIQIPDVEKTPKRVNCVGLITSGYYGNEVCSFSANTAGSLSSQSAIYYNSSNGTLNRSANVANYLTFYYDATTKVLTITTKLGLYFLQSKGYFFSIYW